jgi:hypothetical protein
VEIRKTDDMEQMLLMSSLTEMWAGKRPFPAPEVEADAADGGGSSGGGRRHRKRGRGAKVRGRAAGARIPWSVNMLARAGLL